MINNCAIFAIKFISLWVHMSQFIVSARKYRPQRFDEVVGQEHITTTLKNAIRHNKVAHAFLFCGPRGVGKTTTARILAKTINCENITDQMEACGECPSCMAFQKKNAPNIIELDAASHNSVDDIRKLNEQVRIPPAQGHYKLFIIDEVHMLSISAFNAFLKTLEEPPPSAIFILATTEKHKILPTILSRCQIYDFKRNKVNDILHQLERISQAENLKYDQEALHLIAEKADGALRDALSIFDRMVSFSDGQISYNAVIDQLNVLDYDYFFRLTDHLIGGDLPAAYLLFDQILEKGFSPEVFLLGFQEHLRQLLMIKLSETAHLVFGSTDLQNRYTRQSSVASRDFILTVLDLANECDIHYRFAQNKRLHVEIALMKMAFFPYATQVSSSPEFPANPAVTGHDAGKKNDSIDGTNQRSTPSSNQSREIQTQKNTQNKHSEPDPKENVKISEPPSNPAYPDQPAPKTKTENNRDDEITTPTPSTGQEQSNASVPQPAARPMTSGRSRLPTLNDMDEILDEVTRNDATKTKELKDNEILDVIRSTWERFTENQSSPSVASYLQDSKLSWSDGKIYITVTSKLAKSSILDQRILFEQLREATAPHTPEIIFEIDADPALVPKTPKILTTREKFEALKKSNPNLDNLIRELNLRVEDV